MARFGLQLSLLFCLLRLAATFPTKGCSGVNGEDVMEADIDGTCAHAHTSLLQKSLTIQTSLRSGSSSDLHASDGDPYGYPTDDFLIVSSPTLSKVFWTRLEKAKSTQAHAMALIDGGLKEPKGLSVDRKHGFLYVADSGAEKIFQYTVLVNHDEWGHPTLDTTHARTPVVENCGPVEWVTVDDDGNLFYSSPKSNNINKISLEVMTELASGQLQASALTVASVKTMESDQTSQSLTALPTDAKSEPHIYSIYEAEINTHVAQPAGILADGPDLFWTNGLNGTTAGTVVKGQANPTVELTTISSSGNTSIGNTSSGPSPFPSAVLSNRSSGAFGIAKTDTLLFFSRNDDTTPHRSVVSALMLSSGIEVDADKTMQSPRALAWDSDATMYVADQEAGMVYSFPTGRLMAGVPLMETLQVSGPYGLAFFKSEDPAFTRNSLSTDGVSGVTARAAKTSTATAGSSTLGRLWQKIFGVGA